MLRVTRQVGRPVKPPLGLAKGKKMFGKLMILAGLVTFGLPVAADPVPVALPGGAVVAVEGTSLHLRLTGVTDQRCPADVACVWEGMVQLTLTINPGGPDAQDVVVCNACEDGTATATDAGYVIIYRRLEPARSVIENLGRVPVLADYGVLVRVGDLK